MNFGLENKRFDRKACREVRVIAPGRIIFCDALCPSSSSFCHPFSCLSALAPFSAPIFSANFVFAVAAILWFPPKSSCPLSQSHRRDAFITPLPVGSVRCERTVRAGCEPEQITR